MIFYKYTLNKMFKSVSTYVTGFFGVSPVLVLGIAAMAGYGFGYENMTTTMMWTFPLFVIFIAFKTVQVFRDEIENQTMLTIVSKPFPRKKLVVEGLLSLFTIIVIVSFVGLFIPILGFLRTESDKLEVFSKALLVTLTTILLGSIIASLGTLLSLKMKGKSFIGVMLAVFGIGFCILWIIMSSFIRPMLSRDSTINTFKTKNVLPQDEKGNLIQDVNGNIVYGFQKNGVKTTYIINSKQIYENLLKVNDFRAIDVIKWIDPTLQWQVLYNGGASYKSNDFLTNGADIDIEIISHKLNDDGTYEVVAITTPKSLVPIYYPIILWLLIGGVVIGLSFRTLNKSNIS